MRERKETENECRHTSWPDCLLPSHLCLCWWEDWGRRVWKSHTHTLSAPCRSRTVLFVSTYRWNRLSIEASSHVWRWFWENHTPESHGPEPLTVQLWFVYAWVCHNPSSPAHTPSTPPSWSTYVRKREEMRQRAENEDDAVVYYTRTLSTTVRVQITEAFWHLPLLESQSWSLGIVSLKVNTLDFSSYYVRMLIKFIYITTKVRLQDSQCVCFQFKVNILDLSSCFCKECLYNMFI